MTTIKDIQLIEFPKIKDRRGNLSFVEQDIIPFEIKRIYYLYDVPSGSKRGGHSHIEQDAILIALSGSFDVVLNDGSNEKVYTLNKPNFGLHIVKGIWRELQNFSSGSICLVISSDVFNENDYIRSFKDFKLSKNRVS